MKQLSFVVMKKKRRRSKPGRKPGPRPRVRHRKRAPHVKRHPIQITIRARKALPSFREERVLAMFLRLVAERPRHDFQVVHHSVQGDHLHLIVEAENEKVLARAMNSLEARFAKRFNKVIGRKKGKVWDHRYHRLDLATPTQVKNALGHVLHNCKKHHHAANDCTELDPFSSAPPFVAWMEGRLPKPRDQTDSWTAPPARTWLLAKGWRKAC